MNNAQPKTGPLTEDEVKSALETEGYPFEIRVLEKLYQLGILPFFGERMPTGAEDETRETDVIGERKMGILHAERALGYMSFQLVVEAKRVHDGAFVGFESYASEPFHRMRLQVGGSPSYNVLPGYGAGMEDMLIGDGKLDMALNLLVDGLPWCVQWALPRRSASGKRPYIADHEAGTAGDLFGSTRTAHYLLRNTTLKALSGQLEGCPILSFALPVLALDAPIYTYNVATKHLKQVHRLLLRVTTDTILGTQSSVVDVVDMQGLVELVDSVDHCLGAAKKLFEMDDTYAFGLALVGSAQASKWKDDETQRQVAEMRAAGGTGFVPKHF